MILMIYKADVYKEYILPNTDDENYTIILDKNLFQLRDDVTLRMDIVDKNWKLYEANGYFMSVKSQRLSQIAVKEGDIIDFETWNDEKFQGIVIEAEMAFHIYKKYDITNLVNISIGKGDENVISYKFMGLVSQNHGALVRERDGLYIEDYQSANGIFVNSRRIIQRRKLNFGDVINIFGLTIVYMDNIIAVGTNYGNLKVNEEILTEDISYEMIDRNPISKKKKDKVIYFKRSPRNIPEIIRDKVEIEESPAPKGKKRKPALYVVGPAFTMAIPMVLGCLLVVYSMKTSGRSLGTFMYTGIITAIGSAVVGGIWAIFNLKYDKKTELEEEQERFNAYGNYLIDVVDGLKKKYEQNQNAMIKMYPSAKECCSYDEFNTKLWNRNYTHADFLFERLGIGTIPFQVEIEVPKEKFSIVFDSLKEKPAKIKQEFESLKNVPVGISLNDMPLVGIVGGEGKNEFMEIIYPLAAQIAANNCYTDVKMLFVYNECNAKKWEFARWLPHVWSEDKNTRYIATNKVEAGEIFYDLVNILRRREEEKENFKTREIKRPYYVLFIEDESILEDEPLAKYVYAANPKYGMTTFILADRRENLPNACENIIQNDSNFKGLYNVMDENAAKQNIIFDSVNAQEIQILARKLADIQVKEPESNTEIPSDLTFLQMYGVRSLKELHVIDRWKKNRTFNSMKVPVGKKAGGSLCFLDVHEKYHGPHGLIAGTTGSGKSETLQTYMLSLALNYSPNDVVFFVIDFKGGGMANLFSNLPHMVGQISNLSGNQVRRAMISIKSENKRRQRLFTEHGVNNINLYTRLYKNGEAQVPIPHLLIIIDEFAELKREEPEFMRELISVAQVGRSLGVHLILATQKPAGTVDDNIWSNSKFRLCLRVQDKQDSNDMLHKPDAAYITQAGRCYMQIGNDEVYELFQSAYSGAVYDEKDINNNLDIATMITNTGKTAVVGNRAKIKRKEEEKIKWYCSVVRCIKKCLANELMNSAIAIDYSYLEKMIKDVIAEMNRQGLNYTYGKANETKLLNFIKLMPLDLSDEIYVVKEVLSRASRQGISLPEAKEKTQLEALVSYLEDLAEKNGYEKCMQLWLPVLAEQIYLSDLNGFCPYSENAWKKEDEVWHLNAVVGMYDDPENQSQHPLRMDFAENGHYAVCGSIVSGKSTFLQTTIYSFINKYSPNYLNFYVIDFSSHALAVFDGLSHVGGYINENQLDKIDKFITMILEIIEERKKKFHGGNYSQYVRSNGITIPSIVIVIDGMASFREKTEGKYDSVLQKISREGVGYGIYFLISASGFGLSEIPNRIADNIKCVITLNMGDKFKYMEILRTTRIPIMPEEGVKGRGLVNLNGNILEYQTALSEKAEDDYERATRITELCERINNEWQGKTARKIPEIPENPVLSQLMEKEEYVGFLEDYSTLPYAYNFADASVYSISLKSTYCYVVSGRERTGRTNTLKVLLEAATGKKGKICIFEKKLSELKLLAEEKGAKYIQTDAELFDFFKEMTGIFVKRNTYKQELIAKGKNEEEIFNSMQKFEQIYIFIADITEFFDSIYKPEAGVGAMSGFIENIIDKGILHNIFFIGCINLEDSSKLAMYKAYTRFVSYKSGVHLGGNVNGQRIFNFNNIPFQEMAKTYKRGVGLTPSKADESVADKIIIPLAGR